MRSLRDGPSAATYLIWDYARANGIDLFIGRRLQRLFTEHGLADVHVNPLVHIYPADHARRTLALDFVENLSDRFLEQGLVTAEELAELKAALRRHLEDPATFVISCLYMQAWGHKPQ